MAEEFNLSVAIAQFQDAFGTYELENDAKESLEDLNLLVGQPDLIQDEEIFEKVTELIHCYQILSPKQKFQLGFLVSGALRSYVDLNVKEDLEKGENANDLTHKQILQLYGYVMFVLLYTIGKEPEIKETGKSRNDAGDRHEREVLKQQFRKSLQLLNDCFDTLKKLFSINLSLLFQTSPERNTFIGSLFLGPINSLFENTERMKDDLFRRQAFDVIAITVKHHNQIDYVQNTILQDLTYFPHLATNMAEFLYLLYSRYDSYQLTDNLLKELSSKQFRDDDNSGPPSVKNFLVKLAELAPRLVMRQITLIAQLLDNNSMTLRCGVIEAISFMILDLTKSEEDYMANEKQVIHFLELFEERALDVSTFVRSRAFQGICHLLEKSTIKFTNRRIKWTRLAVKHLEDKSQIVRKNALKLLSQLILNHPFEAIGNGRLTLTFWEGELNKTIEKLKELQPDLFQDDDDGDVANDTQAADDILDHSQTQQEEQENNSQEEGNESSMAANGTKQEPNEVEERSMVKSEPSDRMDIDETPAQRQAEVDPEVLAETQLKYRYFKDCVKFIRIIHRASEKCCELLYSKSKNEVVQVMEFFVLIDSFGVENAYLGIKRMLHLVWMKSSNEAEGNDVVNKLINAYSRLYLDTPSGASPLETSNYIASNLIKLTYNTSMADLASLEKLLGELYGQKFIDGIVIDMLWRFFTHEETTKKQRRGAIIVLGMLALVDNSISAKGLNSILNVGLDLQSKDWTLVAFSCVALKRVVPAKAKDASSFQVPRVEEAISKLRAVMLEYTEDGEWFSASEEALNTVYTISSHPDQVCSDILKLKALSVFSDDEENEYEDKVVSLSQLLFLIGHVGLKTIVHLEKLEAEFKRKKIAAESKKSEQDNELDMIGGNEDEFSDVVAGIREKELLYSPNGLLAKFVPLIKEVVAKQNEYNDPRLQRQAILCLAKFMCISPRFCEENLSTYLELIQNSPDAIVRSNSVLALGDMAVCFNHVIDANKDYLYVGLKDRDLTVQRTCLMTVTFLILAGQVKVKGQLAQMATLYVNDDQGIVDMCKLFFTELATKDNAIYNGFIDMLSGLSADENLESTQFREIIKFVVPFVEKDKQKSQLVNKLYQRLGTADNQKSWDDLAFVIKEIIPKEKKAETATTKMYEEIIKTIEGGFQRPQEIVE